MRWWRISLAAVVLASGCINVNVTVPPSEEVESDVQRVRRAIAEMRNLAVTLEVSLVEDSVYPRAEDGDVSVGRFPQTPLTRIRRQAAAPRVSPPLIPGATRTSRSSGTQYLVLSTAADGRLDEPSRVESFLAAAGGRTASPPVYTTCVEDDLVLVNAQLVQCPNRTIRQCR